MKNAITTNKAKTTSQILEESNARLSNMRLIGNDRFYYARQLAIFAEKMQKLFPDTIRVAFGKQDIRGTESITLFNDRHCVDHQKHFGSKAELLGYVIGYNQCHHNNQDDTRKYI